MTWVSFQQPPAWDDAKRIIAAIIAAAGGDFTGRTRLYKAFYRAHVEFWKAKSRLMTRHRVVWMPHGPGIDQGESLIDEMANEGTISKTTICYPNNDMSSERYVLLQETPIQVSDDELSAIHSALGWLATMTASQASHKSHVDSRAWNLADGARLRGHPLSYELDALTDEEYARLDRAYAATRDQLSGLFPTP